MSQYRSSQICHRKVFIHKWPLCYSYIWVGLTRGTFQIKFKFHTFINSRVSDKKTRFIKNVILPTEYHFSLQLIFVSLVLQYISNDISWIHFMDPFSWTVNWAQIRPRLQGDGVVGCITLTRHMTKFSASDFWSRIALYWKFSIVNYGLYRADILIGHYWSAKLA